MNTGKRNWRTHVPVAVLFNLHADWTAFDKTEVLRETNLLTTALKRTGHPVSIFPVGSLKNVAHTLTRLDARKCIILNWCEMLPGDPHKGEAAVATMLERRNFTFTGSPASALTLSADKAATKQRLIETGVATPLGLIHRPKSAIAWSRFPCIVKSAHEHSSASLSDKSVARSPAQLRRILKRALTSDRRGVMIEDFIEGREINVTVWGNGPDEIAILPPVEIWMDGRRDKVYSYKAKFDQQSADYHNTHLIVPTRIGKHQTEVIRRVALATYRAMGCRDYARIDGRLNGRTFTVLDINPNPDLCLTSQSAYAAKAIGISYGRFVSRLVQFATARHPQLKRHLPLR